jgi:hypothetical protein
MDIDDKKDFEFVCVTCDNCGWVHVAYTREAAEEAVKSFNDYFDTLSEEKQNDYYGGEGASLEKSYLYCFSCRDKESKFHKSKPGDCPDGCTIQPVICEEVFHEDS